MATPLVRLDIKATTQPRLQWYNITRYTKYGGELLAAFELLFLVSCVLYCRKGACTSMHGGGGGVVSGRLEFAYTYYCSCDNVWIAVLTVPSLVPGCGTGEFPHCQPQRVPCLYPIPGGW